MSDGAKILSDFGERRLIAEVLAPRYKGASPAFGDDAASVSVPEGRDRLLVTTDPCPPPMSRQLGFEDYFYDGWLLATINLSDLAAAGAEPVGLLTSLQLPAEMELAAFERLLDGIDACCAEAGAAVLGGNLKEAKAIDLTATAFGWCDSAPLSRVGASPGDLVLAVGDLGLFWAATLAIREGIRDADENDELLRNVLRPHAKTAEALGLRRKGLLSAAMDNSDGLQPSLRQLADANRVGIEVDKTALADLEPEAVEIATALGLDPARLACGWGDWQLIATCTPEDLGGVGAALISTPTRPHVLGRVIEGNGVTLLDGPNSGPLFPLDSERFSTGSWFSGGISGYVEQMRTAPLVDPV